MMKYDNNHTNYKLSAELLNGKHKQMAFYCFDFNCYLLLIIN